MVDEISTELEENCRLAFSLSLFSIITINYIRYTGHGVTSTLFLDNGIYLEGII